MFANDWSIVVVDKSSVYMKTIIEDYIENIVTNHMNIIRKNQCADLLLFCVDILINNSENNNYEKDLNHIISEILLLMKNSPERCAFLLKAGMDNKRTKYETNDYKSSKLYFQ